MERSAGLKRTLEPTSSSAAGQISEIKASKGWQSLNLKELWNYRELLYILVWRDLKVRYRQTLLGAAWVMAQPLLMMITFTLLFNRVAKIEAGSNLPYALFVMAGLLPWNFFASGVQNSGNSLIGSSHLISKIYFPRLIVPAASVLAGLVDLSVASVLLGGMMIWYALAPPLVLVLLPAVALLALGLAMGVGLWLSALNVEYRDIRVVIPFLLQFWMYTTPVVYPLKLLPESLQKLAIFNPMTGIVEGFRVCLLGGSASWAALAVSFVFTIALLLTGAFYFRRTERLFADVL
jgi:lipopolysaccharide transport system permease protein